MMDKNLYKGKNMPINNKLLSGPQLKSKGRKKEPELFQLIRDFSLPGGKKVKAGTVGVEIIASPKNDNWQASWTPPHHVRLLLPDGPVEGIVAHRVDDVCFVPRA